MSLVRLASLHHHTDADDEEKRRRMTATFVLVPGAGGAGEVYWRDVVAGLEARGHTAIPVEIRGDDPALGLPEYAAITDAAIGEHRDVVLVAQSMGGFTVPMISKRDSLARIVLLNAMVPLPGETPGEWFELTGSGEARRAANDAVGRSNEFDIEEVFLHDIPADLKAEMAEGDREPADTPFGQPCTFEAWPDVPIHVLVAADDRLFPAEFQIRVARERLGLQADVMPGGHLVAKSRPVDLTDRLIAYLGAAPATGTAN
jgi:pimeloyl-ACP methyl ester carboxylesterase